ncbi:trehalose-6-phosphate synthase [Pararobbsia alpina]
MSMSRLIVVSNRVAPTQEGRPAAGGLAIGVLDALKQTGGVWFGWSGETVAQPQPPAIDVQGKVTYATVGLAKRDYDHYYRGFSNATLWPALHYRTDLLRYDRQEYAGYLRVNQQFARDLVPMLKDDDVIWVHDYHLIPLAEALREAGVRNPIGFFLHIPFPAPEVFRAVPPHAELAKALMAYDLIGFQTDSDVQAFRDYVTREAMGTSADVRAADGRPVVRLTAYGRTAKAAAYPIGIYPDAIAQAAEQFSTRKAVTEFAQSMQGRKLIMSVDRLDYSKGLAERFLAFENLLQASPHWQRRVSLVQIAPPTRSDVQTYQRIRQNLERETGRINGRFAELDWSPIRYLNRKYDRNLLMALFRIAQVGLVTPLRDGMNLVAKEYVAAQDPSDPGVLVLSQFAGAAEQMPGALVVNPFDMLQMSEAIERALSMPLAERQARYRDMMGPLRKNDLSVWRDSFLDDLRAIEAETIAHARVKRAASSSHGRRDQVKA